MTPARDLPRDAVLPQLGAVLDPAHMARTFNSHMFSRAEALRFNVDACGIERVKYRPGNKCTIGYCLTIHDRATGASHEQRVCGRIFGAGGSRTRYATAQLQDLVKPCFGPPLLHIESLEMVAWTFPNERKLIGLAALTDDDHLRNVVLPEIVESRWGPGREIVGISHRIANYVPEGRLCVRVDLRLRRRRSHSTKTRAWTIFGKTHYNGRGAAAHHILERLWDSESRRRGVLHIPRPLGYQPDRRLFWQEGLKGETLESGGMDPAQLAKAAEALAALHRARIDCGRGMRVGDVVARMTGIRDMLGATRPTSRETLFGLVDRLLARIPRLDNATLVTLHGDLHPKNVFMNGEGTALIDLDDVTTGPPMFDVGGFVARILYRSYLDGGSPASAQPLFAAFIGRYRECVPWPTPALDIAWYTAAALINERAFRCVTRLKSGRMEIFDDLVRLADRIGRDGEHAFGYDFAA